MAAPYYNYAPKDVENQINWSDISSQITKTLDEKRAAIITGTAEKDKEYQDYMQSLNNVAVSDNPDFNRWTNNMTSDMQQAKLQLYRQLQRGEINLREYTFYNNNLTTGTDSFLQTATNLAEWQKQTAARLASGEASALEQWHAARLESFTNLSQTSAYINPKDFTMGVAGLEKDPETGGWKLSSNPGQVMSFAALTAGMNQQYNSFDTNADVQKFVSTLGQDIRVYMERQGFMTVSDVRQRAIEDPQTKELLYSFDQAKANAIESLMANPERGAHILVSETTFAANGKQYQYTDNPADIKPGNEHLILVTADPRNPSSGRLVPQLSAEQKKVVEDKISVMIESQLNRGEDFKQRVQYSTGSGTSSGQGTGTERASVVMVENYGRLYGGTQEEVQTAIEYFKSRDPQKDTPNAIRNIVRDETGVTIYRGNTAEPERIDFVDAYGNPLGFEEAINRGGSLVSSDVALSTLAKMDYMPQYSTSTYSGATTRRMKSSDAISVYRIPEEGGGLIPYGQGVRNSFAAGLVRPEDEDETPKDTEYARRTAELARNVLLSAFDKYYEGSGLVINTYDYDNFPGVDDSFVEIYLPEVMERPVYVPMTSRKAGWQNSVADIMAAIVDEGRRAVSEGRKLNPDDLSSYFMAVDDKGRNAFQHFNQNPRLEQQVRAITGRTYSPSSPASTGQTTGQGQQGQTQAQQQSSSTPVDYGTK